MGAWVPWVAVIPLSAAAQDPVLDTLPPCVYDQQRMPRRQDIATQPYDRVVQSALVAFSQDSGYVERMLSAATAINHKRKVWAVRLSVRETSELARSRCSATGNFNCIATQPCGFGDCIFASPENRRIYAQPCDGKIQRPQSSERPQYGIEPIVALLSAV